LDITRHAFGLLMRSLTAEIGERPLDDGLAAYLNRTHGPESAVYRAVFEACRAAVDAGWMCDRGADGLRYGRVIKPGPETHEFSIDVVEMNRCAGPHHLHPNGEIDLVMPLEATALFDGQGAGWKVYRPGSAHSPTVSGGRALVLYMLPRGAIQFTGVPVSTKVESKVAS
jgi:hypothetical protein